MGGAVMCLVYNARSSTKDIDSIFEPKTRIYEIAQRIAQRHSLPEDGLNDGVKGFLSERGRFEPYLRLSNLNILTA